MYNDLLHMVFLCKMCHNAQNRNTSAVNMHHIIRMLLEKRINFIIDIETALTRLKTQPKGIDRSAERFYDILIIRVITIIRGQHIDGQMLMIDMLHNVDHKRFLTAIGDWLSKYFQYTHFLFHSCLLLISHLIYIRWMD